MPLTLLSSFIEILKQYLPLCWFKSHPLQLPSEKFFLKFNLAFYFVLSFLTQSNMIAVTEAFVEVLTGTGLTLLFVFILLNLNRSMHNYVQVTSAILLCENVVGIFAVPAIAWMVLTHSLFSKLLLTSIVLWNFALITYIMKKVLSIDIWAGLVVSFLYILCTYVSAYALTLAF
jgi:hypothetical protein